MATSAASQPQRIVDVNGRLTTVYKRLDGAKVLPNRLTKVPSAPSVSSPSMELNAYAGDRYVTVHAAESESDLNVRVAATPPDESCLFMISDSTFGDATSLNVNGGASPVLIHLDTLRSVTLTISTGSVVVKTYSESRIPTIRAMGDSTVTVIIAEGTGADVESSEGSTVSIMPAAGAFGTVSVLGDHAAEVSDLGTRHQMLILG